MVIERGDGEMKNKMQRPDSKVKVIRKKEEKQIKEDLFEICIRKGLIEKTEYGYYFKPEFFETLEVYEEE
jgi:hypothetical protein